MRRHFLLYLLVLCFLTACTANSDVQEATVVQTEENISTVITEAELLDLFYGYAYADPANRVVIGCAVMEESQYGILGVVQYTTEDQEGCQFDFIRQGAPPLQAGLFAKALEDSLEFWKTDSVSCQILDEEGKIHICRLTYYQTEVEQGFQIETKQKEG